MTGKFIPSSLKLAVLIGGNKKKVVPFKRAREVKETKALVQAHELLWSKYSSSKQTVVAGKYR